MEQNQIVTINMFVFNEERHMASAIQSILNQTYRNFKLVVFNNGSTDSSGEIAEKFAQQDSRVTVIHLSENDPDIGYKTIELVDTLYYLSVAGHDLYSPLFIEKCIVPLEADPEVVLSYPKAMWLKGDQIIGAIPSVFETRGMHPIVRPLVVALGLSEAYQQFGIYRTEKRKQVKGTGVVGADHVMLTELATLGTFALVDEPLFYMRMADNYGNAEVYRKKHLPNVVDGIKPFMSLLSAYMSIADKISVPVDKAFFKTALFTGCFLRYNWILSMFGESVASMFARPNFQDLADVMSETVNYIEQKLQVEHGGKSVPPMQQELQSWNNGKKSTLRKGRCVADGYARGWGMQYSDLRQRVREDKLYQEARQVMAGRSVMSEDNMMNIFLIIRDYLKNIDFGHIVEFGCYKGGNALFMAYVADRLYPGMRVYAFDTFTGMPETDKRIDAHGAGDFADVDIGELRHFAESKGIVNIEFVQGLFEQTAPIVLPKIGDISLAHIDCDIYSAVSYSYKAVRTFMVPGGYLVFDDATYSNCLGATEAVEDFAIRYDGLSSEQIFPHFVFRAPTVWRQSERKDTSRSIEKNLHAEFCGKPRTSLQSFTPSAPSAASKARVKIAEEEAKGKDLTKIQEGSEFENGLRNLVLSIKPRSIIETGTYIGTGTTRIIAAALRDAGLFGTTFYSIECNPFHHKQALSNLSKEGLLPFVNLLIGLSVPRAILPTVEKIYDETVRNIEAAADDDIFVDHQEQNRVALYHRETDFPDIPEDLLGTYLEKLAGRPEIVILDSGGHMGNVEFNYVIERLQGECYVVLDDIHHVKHNKSFKQIQNDPRFELLISSKEKFGFCIAKFNPQRKSQIQSIKNILFLRPDSIGDNILAASMLPCIKAKYPDARITVLCQDHIAELYESSPFVDSVISFNRSKGYQDGAYRNLIVQQLQALHADLALNSLYSRDPLYDLFALNSGARTSIAFNGNLCNISAADRDKNNKLYTKIITDSEEHKPEIARHRDFLEGIGISVSKLEPAIWLKPEDEEFAEKFFKDNNLDAGSTVCLFAGAQNDVRIYEDYGIALSNVCRSYGFSVIGLGGAGDSGINSRNLEAIGGNTIDLSGKTSLRQTAAILKRCRLAVGAETGLAHMACAVGTPNVILLGGGHFGRFMPYSPLTSIVCLPLECYGCNWLCKYNRVHCVKDINPDVIAEAIQQTLEKESDKPRVFVQGTSLWEGDSKKPHWQSFHNLLNVADVEIIPVGDTPSFTLGIWQKLRSMDKPSQNNFLKEAADEFIQHGEKLFSYNDFEGAEASFRRALEINNNVPKAHNDLGVLYTQTGGNEKALRHYEAAVKLQPDNATFSKNLADFYYVVAKDTQKALELYIRGLSLNPEDIEILLTLGKISIENGQLESAKDFYIRVLAINPQNSDALKIIDLLNKQNQITVPEQAGSATEEVSNPSTGYLVSAIVSTYNSERFMRGCLEDLEAQTIADRLEIVVVDSCSPQNERAIVEEFQKKYPNIKYIRTDKRETVYAAWNRGIKASSGKYITNANTDDRHRKDALETLFDCLERNPDKVLAYADSLVTKVENESFDSCTVSDRFQWPDFNKEMLLNYCFIGPHPMWRRKLHEDLGFFDEKYQTAADYEFWLRAALKYEFLHINEFLGLYLLDESSVSRKGEIPLLEAKEIQKEYRIIYYLDNFKGKQDRNLKKTILFVLHASPEYRYGGTEYYSFNLIKELIRLKNDVRVLYPVYDKQQTVPILVEKQFNGIVAYELHSNQVNNLNIENDNYAYVQLFKQVLSATQFDIVHFHHTLGLPYIFFKVVKDYGIKSCLTLHDFWLMCLNVHLIRHDTNDICDGPTSVSTCTDCLLSGQVHNEQSTSQLSSILKKRKREVTSLLNDIDIISAPSQYVVKKFKQYLKLDKEIIISRLGLPHAKDVSRIRVSSTVRFGYFGGIAKVKNVSALVDAFKIVTGNATLSIWGNGAADDIQKLRDNIKSDNRIQYLGGYLPDKLDGILKSIDVFCNPSLMESYSFTVREALSRNVPVISSNRGALPEIIIDHQNGLLFDPSSVTHLSSVMQEIINDKALLDKLKNNIGPVLSIEEDARLWDLRYKDLLPINLNLVSIIILTFNQLKHTKLCLQSIEKFTPQPHELILVDNGSNDGTLDYLRKYANDHNNVRVISNKENLGFAAGNNQGLAVAEGNYVLMINNDTIVTDGWLGRMLSVFERYPEVGIVGPVSNNVSGPQQVKEASYRSLEDMPSFAEKWSAEHAGESMEYQRVVGFCLLAGREVIDRIGGLDERFGSGNFEDDDFCLRAAAAGYKARIALDAFIHHTGSQTFKGAGINYQQSLLRNWEIFKKKWKIPQELPYGSSYSFNLDTGDLSQYYIPLRGKTDIIQADAVTEKSPLPHPEFTEGLTSILIPVQSIHFNECVSAIKKYTKEPYEIILIDRSDAPKVKKLIMKAGKESGNSKVVKTDKTTSFTKAINAGIHAAAGEYVMLLFDDVVVSEGWLSDMVALLNMGKNVGVVGPLADNCTGLQNVQDAGLRSPEGIKAFRQRNRYRRIPTRILEGFCMLFRRKLLFDIGLFDETFVSDRYVFDDFCFRATIEGYENMIAGDVFVHRNGLQMSGNIKIYDEKWKELDINTPLGRKVAAFNIIQKADTLNQQGQLDKAIAAYIDGIKYTPDEKAVYYGLAGMLLDAKQYRDALDAVHSLPLPDGEEDIKRLEIIAYCKEGLNEAPEEAAMLADRILALDPKNAPALNLKGMMAYKSGDMTAAEDFFNRAIASDPGYGEPCTNLGVMKWAADQKEDALDYLERGFILSPMLTDNASMYHTALTELEQFGRAEKLFKDAKELHPENKRILFLLIDILIKQGKFDTAMEEIERAMLTMGSDEGMIAAALAIRGKVGIKEIGKAAKNRGSLSLCMIVKNEERHLTRCLLSAAPVADEMIVVDTGSTDKTKDIATVFGAKVFDFPWTDDFSEARNQSLERATGDWVLVLDADEVISPLDYPAIEKIVRKKPARPVAFVMRTRNYTDSVNTKGWVANDRKYLREEAGTGWYPSDKVRLFVNDPRVRFENPVHEFVEGTLKKAGIETKFSEIPVHHYGRFDTDKIAQKGKQYFLLGKKKIEEKKGDIKAMKELAVQAAELGEFDAALEMWEKVIALDEKDPMAFLNMSFAYMKQKNYREAMVVSRRALELDPTIKEAVLNYAGCEVVIGDMKKAISLLEVLLKQEPYYPPGMLLIASACYLDGQKERAIEIFETLRRKGFNCTGFFIDEAEDFLSQGRLDRASLLLEAAIKTENISADTAGVFNKLGEAFKREGQIEDAIASFEKAVGIKPDFPEAHYNLGCVYNKVKRHKEAIACYREALRHKPEFAEAGYNMGIAFQELGMDEEAIVCYRATLAQNPALAEPYMNLGSLQQKKGENDAAMESFREAIRLRPDSAEAWCSQGSLFKSMRRYEEALDSFRRAIAIDADLAEAHWNLATLLLMRGDYEQGWKEYAWRSRVRGLEGIHRKYEEPLWQGEDIAGRTILIHTEQGMGDAIQFIRYVRLVAEKGAKVIVEGPGELAGLFSGVAGVHDFISRGNPLPMVDLQCPLMTLPLLFKTTIATIPKEVPYISVDGGLLRKWRDRIGAGQGKVRVGLVWSGNPQHEEDKKRSLPFSTLSRLTGLRTAEFFSLQKGPAAAEVKTSPNGIEFVDYSEELEDFTDTAALIANLDLIISVDTAVAHLAGAIGKTVWTLLPFTPDWRWMLDREDSPWYPSMKLFRQLSEGDWEGVLSRVRAELEGYHN